MSILNPDSGHAPGLPAVTHRALLGAVPLALATPVRAAALPPMASADTPVLRLFRHWDALRADTEDRSRPMSDEELEARIKRLHALELRWKASQRPASRTLRPKLSPYRVTETLNLTPGSLANARPKSACLYDRPAFLRWRARRKADGAILVIT